MRRPRIGEGGAANPRSEMAPSYKGRRPASVRATAAARGSSKKIDTKCEVLLRKALWSAGFRYRKNVPGLPGKPDILFSKAKIAIFCDGDFWHGRDWESRRHKLSTGTNSDYWIAKIRRNIERDRDNTARLEEMGWTVLRFWETQILAALQDVVKIIASNLQLKKSRKRKQPA